MVKIRDRYIIQISWIKKERNLTNISLELIKLLVLFLKRLKTYRKLKDKNKKKTLEELIISMQSMEVKRDKDCL